MLPIPPPALIRHYQCFSNRAGLVGVCHAVLRNQKDITSNGSQRDKGSIYLRAAVSTARGCPYAAENLGETSKTNVHTAKEGIGQFNFSVESADPLHLKLNKR